MVVISDCCCCAMKWDMLPKEYNVAGFRLVTAAVCWDVEPSRVERRFESGGWMVGMAGEDWQSKQGRMEIGGGGVLGLIIEM